MLAAFFLYDAVLYTEEIRFQGMRTMGESIEATTTLQNSIQMPWLGLGVLHIPDGEVIEQVVQWALECDYRSIDTAAVYKNETGIGAALHKAVVPRDEIFLTTKLWNSDQGYESTLQAFQASLQRLGTDYVDLYLIHWPGPDASKFIDSWRALESLYKAGKARAIGVSNFQVHHLEPLLQESEIPPMVDQIEFHPHLQQPELIEFCVDQGIQVEAWRPIMKGDVINIELLQELGKKYGKTPVQVTLRWIIQRGFIAIPKSQDRDRIRDNANVFDFQLESDEIEQIDALDIGHRLGPDPDTFDLDF